MCGRFGGLGALANEKGVYHHMATIAAVLRTVLTRVQSPYAFLLCAFYGKTKNVHENLAITEGSRIWVTLRKGLSSGRNFESFV